MRIRILVADQSEASLYDLHRQPQRGPDLALVTHLTDPQARQHDRDLGSDRPGRVYDHAPLVPGRRGATLHHSTGGERRPRRLAAESFARHIAGELKRAQHNDEFDAVIVMAGPAFLGLLRETFPASLRAQIRAEVPKDLVHQDSAAVCQHVPEELLRASE